MPEEAKSAVCQAQAIRLTVFVSERVAGVDTLWRDVTGQDPQIDEQRPREESRRQGGAFSEGFLEVQISPMRLDWILSPYAPSGELAPDFIGPTETVLKAFDDALMPWLGRAPIKCVRLAQGISVVWPTSSKEDSYRRLKLLLKSVNMDVENSSDFFYQINWPKVSGVVPSLKLNRLTKWHSLVARRLQLSIAPTQASNLAATPFNENHYARLETDNSTDANNSTPFENRLLVPIYNELEIMARENIEKGERP